MSMAFTCIHKCQAFKQNHLVFKELFQVRINLFHVSSLTYMVKDRDILQRVSKYVWNFISTTALKRRATASFFPWLKSKSPPQTWIYLEREGKKRGGNHQVSRVVLVYFMFARFVRTGWGPLKSIESILRQQEGTCCASFYCEFTLTRFSSLIPE